MHQAEDYGGASACSLTLTLMGPCLSGRRTLPDRDLPLPPGAHKHVGGAQCGWYGSVSNSGHTGGGGVCRVKLMLNKFCPKNLDVTFTPIFKAWHEIFREGNRN